MPFLKFETPVKAQGDSFSLGKNDGANLGKPLIVVPIEYREHLITKFSKEPGHDPLGDPAVYVDVVDIRDTSEDAEGNPVQGRIYTNVLWMNPAVVDCIAPVILNAAIQDKTMAVKGAWQTPKHGGKNYIVIQNLEGQEEALAEAWYASQGHRIAEARAKWLEESAQVPARTGSPLTGPALSTMSSKAKPTADDAAELQRIIDQMTPAPSA